MNDLQVLDIMNRRKLSREHVVSNLGMVQVATKHFADYKPGKTNLLTILLNQVSQVHLFYYLEVNPVVPLIIIFRKGANEPHWRYSSAFPQTSWKDSSRPPSPNTETCTEAS